MTKCIHYIIDAGMIFQQICSKSPACHMKTAALYIISFGQDTVKCSGTYFTSQSSIAEGKEEIDMCEAVEAMLSESEAKGIEKGMQQGKKEVKTTNVKQSMKESVQKMSGRKKYKGERYSFFRDKKLGHGGNGAVYDVKLEEKDDLGFPVVAKFFEYSGDDKEKRYNSVNCNRK